MTTLAEKFEDHRKHLKAVALRMLGSGTEADDAVQEAWLRVSAADSSAVDNLGGWLTTVVARVCLDHLRARKALKEDSVTVERAVDPEQDVVLGDSIGPALLLVLETLAPAERLAFVLHDMFAVSFEEIAAVIGRSEAAARQLASRGRRRVQGAPAPEADLQKQRAVVDAFLRASKAGDFGALLQVLHPDVVVRADETAVKLGTVAELRGTEAVTQWCVSKARGADPAIVGGWPAAAWAPNGKLRVAFDFVIEAGRIVEVDLVGDPARQQQLGVALGLAPFRDGQGPRTP